MSVWEFLTQCEGLIYLQFGQDISILAPKSNSHSCYQFSCFIHQLKLFNVNVLVARILKDHHTRHDLPVGLGISNGSNNWAASSQRSIPFIASIIMTSAPPLLESNVSTFAIMTSQNVLFFFFFFAFLLSLLVNDLRLSGGTVVKLGSSLLTGYSVPPTSHLKLVLLPF